MSWRRQLKEIEAERHERLRRDLRLRADLKWQFSHLLMLAQIADQGLSFLDKLFGGRRGRHSRGH